MEQVPFLGRKGLEGRVVCGVWERRREGEKERERKKRERKGKERISLSIPIHKLPCGADPSWDSPNTLQPLSKHTTTQPLSIEPRPKNGGSPPPPHQGKGRKKRRKRALSTHTILYFSLWGRTPRPPLLTGTRKKKTRKARARVNLTSRTKSIDLNETS